MRGEVKRKSMAVVRPYAPNFAELAMYRALLDEFAITYFYTGPSLGTARRELDALGLGAADIRRYRGYTDVVSFGPVQRLLDFGIGVGSWMATGLRDVLTHDIVNVVDPVYAFTGQVARAVRPGQKLVVVRWEVIPNRYDRVLLARARTPLVFARADAIVCTTEAARDSLGVALGNIAATAPVEVVYPGIVMPEAGVAPDGSPGVRICCVARLQWQKGVDDLLGALAMLRHTHRVDASLCLVGSGNAAPWRAQARRYDIERHVAFTGALPNAEVRRLIGESTVYCQPSSSSQTWCEQFGFAVVEAMALGRPVVICHSGALAEVVGPDALLAASRNASSLAGALLRAIGEPGESRARGERLAARARERYDARVQGQRLLDVVRAL